ncbi:MAG: PEP-CTERM sorting domain-containing protein [Leptolyngbya sp. RL_3_1]|nr:PEP-CTERM sorting domain-containing protein [Leptolyngbya sp. RL_3_1]
MQTFYLSIKLVPRLATVTALALGAILSLASTATAATFRVIIENLAPNNGTPVTPVWFGIHDGTFDLYDRGAPASAELERIAEDGNIAPLNTLFAGSTGGVAQGSVFGPTIPPITPGETGTADFRIDLDPSSSLYFSYASMILPSNDAFIANGNPLAHQLFDDAGNFLGLDFIVPGSAVLDAGTEANDELESTTAFFSQSVPDTGTPTIGGTVEIHPGFIPGGRILSAPQFANADFTADGYDVVRIRVEKVPEPGTVLGLLALGGSMVAWKRRRQMQTS